MNSNLIITYWLFAKEIEDQEPVKESHHLHLKESLCIFLYTQEKLS